MQLDVDAIVSRDVCLCALRVEANNRIQGAPVFFFFSFIHLSLLSRFHLIHYWRRNATRVWIKRPIFFLSIDDIKGGTTEQNKKKTAPVDTGSYTLKKETVNSLVYFRLVVAMIFFLFFLSPTFLFSRLFYLGPSIQMAVYTLERERANKRLLYYWFSLHLGHFWQRRPRRRGRRIGE